MTALENVMVGRHLHEEKGTLAHLLALPSVGRQNSATAAKARELLAFVGLAGQADRPAAALAYGALKRLEMARALACEPKLLLLDEPAAGCNNVETQEIERLIREVAAREMTVALVEHAMKLVMRVSDRILVLNCGRKLAEGTAEEVRANRDVIAAYLGPYGCREAAHA
jgi:branched-chain amino acid transport system ATP-binding protein